MRLIAFSGPFGLLFFGVAAALTVGYLCGARRVLLIAVGLMAVPLTFVGIVIHDLLDLNIGLSPLTTTVIVVSTITGACAGLVASLWPSRHSF